MYQISGLCLFLSWNITHLDFITPHTKLNRVKSYMLAQPSLFFQLLMPKLIEIISKYQYFFAGPGSISNQISVAMKGSHQVCTST